MRSSGYPFSLNPAVNHKEPIEHKEGKGVGENKIPLK